MIASFCILNHILHGLDMLRLFHVGVITSEFGPRSGSARLEKARRRSNSWKLLNERSLRVSRRVIGSFWQGVSNVFLSLLVSRRVFDAMLHMLAAA